MNLFDNQPIHTVVDGQDQYLDWAEGIQGIHHRTRDLHEALLHRDPEKARQALMELETAVCDVRTYLEHRDVVTPLVFDSEHNAPDADLGFDLGADLTLTECSACGYTVDPDCPTCS